MSPDHAPPSPPALPSRRLRWLAWGARALLTVSVAAWLLLGLAWVLIQGWIVPRISDLRPQLEQAASSALGLPVRIGQITAEGGGWVPSFELRDVRLLDADGRPALQLARVQAALSPRSLLKRSFEQLVVEQPELDLRRQGDGTLLVAGLAVSLQAQGPGHALADWFFSQPEFVFRGGTLHWTDELAGTAPVTLTNVDWVMRNPGRRHLMRLDATPPAAWGERFSLRGVFRQPLLSLDAGQWSQWSGQLYAEFQRADLAELAPYAPLKDLGVTLDAGQGTLRAWADVDKGLLTGGLADLALQNVTAQLGPNLAPLQLSSLTGRLGARSVRQGTATGTEWRTEGLSFATRDGRRWPGGNVLLHYSGATAAAAERSELQADKLDLAALALIADRLPLPDNTRHAITRLAPQGLVETLQAQWQGPLEAPVSFSAQGRVSQLALASQAHADEGKPGFHPGRPGVSGAELEFSLNQNGGRGKLQLNRGWLEFPGVFDEPRVALDRLSADINVKRDGSHWSVDLRKVQLANADAQGQFQAQWHTGDGAGARWPGVLDLQGKFSRGDASQVQRYLPLALSDNVRRYVRTAVTQGQLSDVNFKVKGDLRALPFAPNAQGKSSGDFRVSAKLKNGSYAYVPSYLETPGSKPWPALEQVDADLLFDHARLQVTARRGRLVDAPGIVLSKASARVADLARPVVEVSADLKGPLGQALQVINGSPIGGLTSGALARATGSGSADYAFRLNLPLGNLPRAGVQGSVTLPGNDLQFTPDTPLLGRLRGALQFSESGFSVANAQARVLGGDLRFEGGSRPANRASMGEPDVIFRGQGLMTAEGLGQARELGTLSPLAAHLNGSAAYGATLGFRQGQAELTVASNLQGLGLDLPAPLNKPAASAWPLRFEKTVLRESLAPGKKIQDQLLLNLGPGPGLARPVTAVYVRDISGAQAQVLRGALNAGQAGEQQPLPAQGVRLNLALERIDLDAWSQLNDNPAATAGSAAASVNSYAPSSYAVRARELKLQGNTLHQVAVTGSREGLNWRAQVSATEVDGLVEFRQASGPAANSTPGRLFARLSRLSLAASSAQDVESTLLQTQPGTLPALDIVVDELELRGKKLGRLEVDAVNRTSSTLLREGGREWRLNKLNLRVPEASFTASGQWSALGANNASAAGNDRRGTAMNFKLDVADSGELLKRLGMDGLIRRGRGRLEGQVGWDGSPLGIHYPSMRGQFNLAMESGQFLKADPGVAKLLGVLSLQALPRRLTLDFRDVFSDGFAFDAVRGDVTIEQGVAFTNNFQMLGVNAAVQLQGQADLARETQDLKVVVVPDVNAGTASLIASTINPVFGVGTLLAQLFLRRPLKEAATQEFHITSTWSDPRITQVDRKAARAANDKP